jgi:hypothetical protein
MQVAVSASLKRMAWNLEGCARRPRAQGVLAGGLEGGLGEAPA